MADERYVFVYKCRLCGKAFKDCFTCKALAEKFLIQTACYFCGQTEHGVEERPTVNCKDCDGYEAGYSAGLKDAERPIIDKVVEVLPGLKNEIIDSLPEIISKLIKCSECSFYRDTWNVIPTQHGEWINHRNDNGHNIADCSLCGKATQWHDEDEDGVPRYCWYCGAKMKGGEE